MLNLPEGTSPASGGTSSASCLANPSLERRRVNIHNEVAPCVARNIKEIYDADIAANIEGWTAAWFSAYGDATVRRSPRRRGWRERCVLNSRHRRRLGRVQDPPALESGGPRASNWGGSNLAIADQIV